MENKYAEKEYVELGLSVMWAADNFIINDDSPIETNEVIIPSDVKIKTPNGAERVIDVFKLNQDIAKAWGEGWRLPTISEMTELSNCCRWQWEYFKKGKESGYRVYGKNGKSIFFPVLIDKEDNGNNIFDCCDKNKALYIVLPTSRFNRICKWCIAMDGCLNHHFIYDNQKDKPMYVRPVFYKNAVA